MGRFVGTWRAYRADEATLQIAANGTFNLRDHSVGAPLTGTWRATGLFGKGIEFNGVNYPSRVHDDGMNNLVMDLRVGNGTVLDRQWYRKIKGDWMF